MSDAATLGKYELLARLGRGRNCEVFLAVRRGAERRRIVALKRLRSSADADDLANSALLREAELAAMIKHPKVVDVYEYGEEDGICYIAMEYLAGQPLGALIKRQKGGLPQACIARIGADVADGLHATHRLRDDDGNAMELVHLDVSPSNVQVTYDGHVLLVDFGLARAVGREPTTRGKIGYLAPEQIARETPDARTDIFALGVVLWEAATGQRLFRKEDREQTLKAISESDAPPPSSVRSDLDPALDEIIGKALARDREERFSSAAELAKALRSYLADSDVLDTAKAISEVMLEHFAEERAASEKTVAEALKVLAGEQSGPQYSRALSDVGAIEAGQIAEEAIPDSATDAESEYYYYDDDNAAKDAPAEPDDDDRQSAVAAASVVEPAKDDAPSDSIPVANREDADNIDGPMGDDDHDDDIIGGANRTWMVIAAAAVLIIGIGTVVALSGKDDSASRSEAKVTADESSAANSGQTEPAAPPSDSPQLADAGGEATVAARAAELAAAEAARKEAADNARAMDEAAAAKKAADDARLANEAADRLRVAAAEKAEREKAEAAAKAAAAKKARDAARKAKAAAAKTKKPVDKDKARAAYKAASRLLVTGDTAGAIKKYREALSAWPGYSPALRGLGLASESRGDSANAVRYYKRYLRAAPRAKDADSIRGRISRLGG